MYMYVHIFEAHICNIKFLESKSLYILVIVLEQFGFRHVNV